MEKVRIQNSQLDFEEEYSLRTYTTKFGIGLRMDIKINGSEKYSLEISLYICGQLGFDRGPEYFNEGRKSFQ